jgi:hypothetical protein
MFPLRTDMRATSEQMWLFYRAFSEPWLFKYVSSWAGEFAGGREAASSRKRWGFIVRLFLVSINGVKVSPFVPCLSP